MKYRYLGDSGLRVSELCLGGIAFGGVANEDESSKIIDRSLDYGINFIDTADQYNEGRSEEIIGGALRGRRHSVVLATKVQVRVGSGPNDEGLSRAHIMRAVDDSLRRLQTDYIDLYLAHFPDPCTALTETMRTLDDLIRQGKVRYIGCCNHMAWQVSEANWTSKLDSRESFMAVQNRYSILFRDIERELLPFCSETGIGVMAYGTLAAGFLAGRYAPKNLPRKGERAYKHPWYSPYLNEKYFRALKRLEAIAAAHEKTVSQLAIAWVLSPKVIDATLPGGSIQKWAISDRVLSSVVVGISTIEQLEENVAGTGWSLPQDDLAAVDRAMAKL